MKQRITILKSRIRFKTIFSILPLLFVTQEIIPQVVLGKLVDENGDGLASVNLELYINPNVYTTISQSDGSFTFTGVSDVEDEQLPTGYYVSNNFPNPFNPTTRLMITLPMSGNVRVAIYNILGEIVSNEIEKYLNAGVSNIDLDLKGLPNGLYFAKISIDEKYTIIKKMVLLYGSQHLSVQGSLFKPSIKMLSSVNKTSFETTIDSIVARSPIIGHSLWETLPPIEDDTLILPDLEIPRYCPEVQTVEYEGKTYHTVIIGSQCWLKENLDVGTMIPGNQNATDNGIIEKYCYDDAPANCDIYGGLYQWDEAMQYSTSVGEQGICPPGWHIPSWFHPPFNEFLILDETVEGDGNALKAIGQGSGDGAGTNISGFSALLSGMLLGPGSFFDMNIYGYFWSSTEHTSVQDLARAIDLWYNWSTIRYGTWGKDHGLPVRCIKD